LRKPLQQVGDDLAEDEQDRQMLDRLYAVQLEVADHNQREKAPERYANAFRAYGIDVLALDPEEAARRIGRRAIAAHLVSVLDHWLDVGRDQEQRRRVLRVVEAVDRNPATVLKRLREASLKEDAAALRQLAAEVKVKDVPRRVLDHLASALDR